MVWRSGTQVGSLSRVRHVFGPAVVAALVFAFFAGPGWVQAEEQAAESARDTDLLVLPLVTSRLPESTVSELSAALLRSFSAYPGLEVRAYVPPQPIDPSCLRSAPCLQSLGVQEGASSLLLGLARPNQERIALTLILFDVAVARPVQKAKVDLADSAQLSRVLRPVVHEIAMAAGGGAEPSGVADAEAASGSAPAASSGEPGVRSAEAGGKAPAEGEAVPEPTSIDALLDIPLGSSLPEEGQTRDSAASTQLPAGEVSSVQSSPGEIDQESSLSEKERLKLEKARRRAMAREAKKEQKRREKERKELERRREAERKAAARAAEEKRKQELIEARRRQAEQEKRRKAEEKWRATNQKRAKKGLPPLPKPESLQREKEGKSAVAAVTGTGSVSSEASSPGPGPGRAPEPTLFLENESPWQVGTFGGLSYFEGFGLLGTGLEVAYSTLPWLWFEGAFESLHAKNPDTALWFYLFNARVGAVARRVDGPLHPYGGLDAVVLLFGPSAWAVGGTGRTGLDVMVGRGVGIRVELGAGVLHSSSLVGEVYQYPAPNALFVRFGLGVRYRF